MSQKPIKHVVYITTISMTHARPALNLCARLLAKFPDLFISFYVAQGIAVRAETYAVTHHPTTAPRIRIVPAPIDIIPRNPIPNALALVQTFGPWIAEQVSSHSFEINGFAVETPSYIIEDYLYGGIALATLEFHNLPFASCWMTSVVSFLSVLKGNQYRNKDGSDGELRETLTQQPSRSKYLNKALTKQLAVTPGLPASYEHERFTQDVDEVSPFNPQMIARLNHMLEHTKHIVFVSLYEMEPIAAESMATTLPKPNTAYCSGLAADLPRLEAQGLIDHETHDPALQFMNRAYTELGPHSVVYIGLGTIFFPPAESASYLRVIIDELVAHGLRVVFSIKPQYTQMAGLDENYMKELTQAGHAIFLEWVQQTEVLEHPAMHYFVSHGGWNSTTESIVRGVPMIFWPVAFDQPANAVLMTRQHDCGFELLQVRTGDAKSVAYTDQGDVPIVGSADAVRAEIREILALAQGERGAEQRRNVKALSQVAGKALDAGGSGDVALEKFGKAIGL